MATPVTKKKVLLIEDDPDVRELVKDYYGSRQIDILPYEDADSAIRETISELKIDGSIEAVLCDLYLPGGTNGMDIIQQIHRVNPHLPVVLMTAHSSLEVAVDAIEKGAYDFVVKPLHFAQLTICLDRAIHFYRIARENERLKLAWQKENSKSNLIYRSQAMKAVSELARRISNYTSTVLIQGESGTGKEVIARQVHSTGNRKDKPFVAINCSAIPDTLLESELFGYGKGAFTGAHDQRAGLFEEANGGTLFLDEIGDIPISLQAKLLRVLQDKKVKRLGENNYRPIDVRIVAATHRPLLADVKEGRFREDLFYRLNVIPIRIPSLRERREDILPLADHFLKRFSMENGIKAEAFTPSARQWLLNHPWPGNVRELENTVERAVVLSAKPILDIDDLRIEPSPITAMTASAQATAVATAAAEENAAIIAAGGTPNELPPAAGPATAEAPAYYAGASAYALDSAGPTVIHVETPIDREAILKDTAKSLKKGEVLFCLPDDEELLPTLDQVVSSYMKVVLERSEGVKERATRILQVDRKTLYRRLKEEEAARSSEVAH